MSSASSASGSPRGPARLAARSLAWLSAGVTGFYLFNLARTVADLHSVAPLSVPPGAPPEPASAQPPAVSVIVPARDEEQNIRRCVESLLAQDHPSFEVIVVDDGSTDATPDILAQLQCASAGRLRVARVTSLPDGWAGKPHALHVGARMARGKWLLFTDADTRHAPAALRSAVARAERDGADLFSISAAQDLPGFWNRTLMPIAVMCISFMYSPSLVNNPHIPVAIANGQFLMIRHAFYDRIGGYDTDELRGTVVDDLALARRVKRCGGRLLLVDGRSLVTTAMYRSLAGHWDGWSKNAIAGAPGGALIFALLAPWLPLITIAPFAALASGLLRRNARLTLAGAAPVAATLAYRAYLDHMLDIPQRYGWTHPLGGAIFTAILARAFWYRLRGATVPWRGRSYATAARARR
ncbi:MAG TPA: glycosyltransferase family 2 protein [Ktedonobacterales bacterium]|jgi:chlorobactene glucosyltransferase